jgi:hypothetical protein
MDMYFRLMVSSICNAQKNGSMSDIWKFMSNLTMAVAMSANVLVVYVLTNKYLFPHVLDFMEIKFTDIPKWNFLFNITAYTIIPFMAINYYLVFVNDQFRSLIKEFKTSYNKKYFTIYFGVSFVLAFLLIFTKKQ